MIHFANGYYLGNCECKCGAKDLYVKFKVILGIEDKACPHGVSPASDCGDDVCARDNWVYPPEK
jgi:hypothetical protein